MSYHERERNKYFRRYIDGCKKLEVMDYAFKKNKVLSIM